MPAVVPLLLASASPARLATLRSAGVEPLVQVSGVDERAALRAAERERGGPLAPADVALALARAKAERVVEDHTASTSSAGAGPGLLVLGCDSVLELDGQVHGKPADAREAIARWRRMRGRTGVLHSGHWLVDLRAGHRAVGGTASTTVHFADLADDEIEAYVATGEPLHVAGAFTVDGLGGPYVTGVEGDYHAVVGLSLPLLRDLLGRLDLRWHALRGSAR